jgi:hypothetical protein
LQLERHHLGVSIGDVLDLVTGTAGLDRGFVGTKMNPHSHARGLARRHHAIAVFEQTIAELLLQQLFQKLGLAVVDRGHSQLHRALCGHGRLAAEQARSGSEWQQRAHGGRAGSSATMPSASPGEVSRALQKNLAGKLRLSRG